MVNYECSNCGKNYVDKLKYTKHVNRKYPCRKINRNESVFTKTESVSIQTDNIYVENKNDYQCLYCGKIFTTNSNWNRHVKENCKIKRQQDDEKETTHKKLLEELEFVKKQNEEYEKLKEQMNKQNNKFELLKNKLDENDQLKTHNNELQIIINNALLNDNKLIYSTKKVNPKKPRLVCVDNDVASSSNSLQPFINQPAIFTFNNKTFEYVNDIYNKFWFNGKDVTLFIGYKNPQEPIRDHINKKYIKTLEQIDRVSDSLTLDHNEKTSIYISEEGLYQLLTTSKLKNDIIKTFKNWVFEEILPSIRKTGKYEIPNIFSNVKSFYNDHMITSFLGKKVVYLGITSNIFINNGIVEYLAKYGKSGGITRRDIDEHRKFFNEFKVVFIRECDNYEDIEKLFELELKVLELYRKAEIKGVMCKELFTVKDDYKMDNIINMLNKLIDNNPLESIKEKNNKIKELESNLELEKLKEITKQREFENDKIKLENDKIKLEIELKK